jgi:hypothetical protein
LCSHGIHNFDVQCNNFSKIDNIWWWPYTDEMCSEEEEWLDNKLHLRWQYSYMCTTALWSRLWPLPFQFIIFNYSWLPLQSAQHHYITKLNQPDILSHVAQFISAHVIPKHNSITHLVPCDDLCCFTLSAISLNGRMFVNDL